MITQQQKDVMNDYAEIKLEIKRLEEKADFLNPQILELMQANEIGEINIGDLGKLSIGSRRAWKYSQNVKEVDAKLKELKKTEEMTGEATYTENFYPIFKGAKNESMVD